MSMIHLGGNGVQALPRKARARKRWFALAAAVAGTSLFMGAHASANSVTWTGSGGNNLWSTNTNWDAAPSPNDDLNFTSFGALNFANMNDDKLNFQVNSLSFNDNVAAISIGSTLVSNTLLIGAGGITSSNNTGVTFQSTLGLVFTGDSTIADNAQGDLTLNGSISGAGVLSVNGFGGGRVVLGGANTAFTGTWALNSGTLSVADVSALGSASQVRFGFLGGLEYSGAGSQTLVTPVDTSSGASTFRVSNAAGVLQVNSALSNQLTKTGPGTLVLGSAFNNLNTVNISGGVLSVQSIASLGAFPLLQVGDFQNSGTLRITGVGLNESTGAFTSVANNAGGSIFDIATGSTLTLAGDIGGGSGTGAGVTSNVGVQKKGGGTLVLSGLGNQFTGNLVVSEGTLQLTAPKTMGDGWNAVVIDGGTLQLMPVISANPLFTAPQGWDPGQTAETALYAADGANSANRRFIVTANGGTLQIDAPRLLLNDGTPGGFPDQFVSPAGSLLHKTGAGELILGQNSTGFGNSFLGNLSIDAGDVRLDHPEGAGKNEITVNGGGRLLNNVTTPAGFNANTVGAPINLHGGTLASVGGDKTFSGAIRITDDVSFASGDGETAGTNRTTTLSGQLIDNGHNVIITGNAGNASKGLLVSNLGTGPAANQITGSWNIQNNGVLMIGTDGANYALPLGAVHLNNSAAFGADVGPVIGYRTDTPGITIALPANIDNPSGNYGIHVGGLTGTLTGQTVDGPAMSLASGQQITVSGANGYIYQPASVSLGGFGTAINVVDGTVAIPAGITTNGNDVTVRGNANGVVLLNAAAPTAYTMETLHAQGGNVKVTAGNSLQVGLLDFAGGGIALDSGAASSGVLKLGGNLTVAGNGQISSVGTGAVPGIVNLGGTRQIDVGFGSTLRIGAQLDNTGGIEKTNTGTLLLSGANQHLSTKVTGGILEVGSNSALGTAPIELAGGTLQFGDTSPGALVQTYHYQRTASPPPEFATLTAFHNFVNTHTPFVQVNTNDFITQQANLDYGANGFTGAPFAVYGDGAVDDVTFRLTGKINLPVAGNYTFATLSDDGSMIWIDGKDAAVVSSNVDQAPTKRTSAPITLSAGLHTIEIQYYERGGGAQMQAFITAPGQSESLIPLSSFVTTGNVPTSLVAKNNVDVTSSSGIDMSSADSGQNYALGTLSRHPGTTLTVSGLGRSVTFDGTSLDASIGGPVSFAGDGDVRLGQISRTGAGAIALDIQSSGSVILDHNSGTPNDLTNTSFELNGGRLWAIGAATTVSGGFDPLAGKNITVTSAGGTLRLGSSSTTVGAVPFLDSLILNADGGIEHVGTTSDTLGDASHGITINAGTLSINPLAGTLTVAGAISGPGGVAQGTGGATNAGTAILGGDQANTFSGPLTVNSGTLVLSKTGGVRAAGDATVNGGTLRLGGDQQLASLIPATSPNLTMNGGKFDANGFTQNIGNLNMTAGSVISSAATPGRLNIGTISATGPGLSIISARVVSGGAHTILGGGNLYLHNTSAANPNDFTGSTFTVSGGSTLRADGAQAGTISALNNGRVILSGGTLDIVGNNFQLNGLTEKYFTPADIGMTDLNNNGNSGDQFISFQNPANLTSRTTGSNGTLNNIDLNFGIDATTTNAATFATRSGARVGTTQFAAAWFGQINVGGANLPAGQVSFGTSSDDGSSIYVDLNRDGIYETNELVVNNLATHGMQARTGTVTLNAGTYNIAIGYYQVGGGGQMQAKFAPGQTTDFANAMQFINPANPAQDGVWSFGNALPADMSGTNVDVLTDSTINISATKGSLGILTPLSGTRLTVAGGSRQLSFTKTDLAGVPGQFTVISDGPTLMGQIDDHNNPWTLISQGAGTLIFNQTALPNNFSHSLVQVSPGGSIQVMPASGGNDPLGGGSVELLSDGFTPSNFQVGSTGSGGGTVIASLTLDGVGALEHVGTNDDTFGDATHGVSIPSGGKLILKGTPILGSLTVGGAISGSSDQGIQKDGNATIVLGGNSPNTYTGPTVVNGGVLRLAKNAAGGGNVNAITGDPTINGGALQLGANNQMSSGTTLHLLGGSFDNNGFSQTVANLDLQGGGTSNSTPATGMLTVTGSIVPTSGSSYLAGPIRFTNKNININGGATLHLGNTATANPSDFTNTTVNVPSGSILQLEGGRGGANNSGAMPGGKVILAGGTLSASAGFTGNGLKQSWFNNNVAANQDAINGNGGFLTMTPDGSNVLTGGLRYDNDAQFAAATTGGNGVGVDNYSFLWTGTFKPAVSGQYKFAIGSLAGAPNNDDEASAWIDLNQDGVFEFDQGEKVFRRACCGGQESVPLTLVAGQSYQVAFAHTELGGGSSYNAYFAVNTGSGFGPYTLVNPSSQAGQWLTTVQGPTSDSSSTAIDVQIDSTIQIDALSSATMGALTRHGGTTLTIAGGAGKSISFVSTTLTGSGDVSYASDADITFGRLSDGTGSNFRVLNTGAGSLIFNNNTSSNDFNSTTVEVGAGGRIVGILGANDPFGGATLHLAGDNAALRLTSNAAGAAPFLGTITIDGDKTAIEHTGNFTDTIGSNTQGVNVNGTGRSITINVSGGQLNVPGGINNATVNKTGDGTLNLNGSQAAAQSYTGLTVNGGTLNLAKTGAPLTLTDTTIARGAISFAPGTTSSLGGNLTVTNGSVDLGGTSQTISRLSAGQGSINNGSLSITDISQPFNVTGGRVFSINSRLQTGPGTITVNRGTLAINNTSPTSPNSIGATAYTIGAGGALALNVTPGGSSAIGNAPITLNGGTLRVGGDNGTTIAGLTGQYYNTIYPHNAFFGQGDNPNSGNASIAANTPAGNNQAIPFTSTTAQGQFAGLGWAGLAGDQAKANSFFDSATPVMTGLADNLASFSNTSVNSFTSSQGTVYAGSNNLTARFTGQISLPAGVTTFFTGADDGMAVYIDGQLVVLNNRFRGAATVSGSTPSFATAGQHDIEVAYYQGTGGGNIPTFQYSAPGITQQTVPASILSTAATGLSNLVTANDDSTIRTDAAGGTLASLAINGQVAFEGGALIQPAGTTTVAPGSIFRVVNSSSFAGLNGAFDLNKSGPGIMVLTGPNAYTGSTNIGAGILRANDTAALNPSQPVNVNFGASLDDNVANLDLSNVVTTVNSTILLSQAQTSGGVPTAPIMGSLNVNVAPAAGWGGSAGPVFGNYGQARLAVAYPNASLTFGSASNQNGILNMAGNQTFNGQLKTFDATDTIFKIGNDINIKTSQAGLTGTIVNDGGQLVLSDQGKIPAAASIKVYNSNLVLDNNQNGATGNITGRIGAPVNLMGGQLVFANLNNAASSDTVATVNAFGISSIVVNKNGTVPGTSGGDDLTITTLNRNAGTTIDFRGSSAPGTAAANTPHIFIGNNPLPTTNTATTAIVPWATANSMADWAVYDPTLGVKAYSAYTTNIAGAAATANVVQNNGAATPANDVIVSSAQTINSLKLTASNNIQNNLTLNADFSLASGGLLFASGANNWNVNGTGRLIAGSVASPKELVFNNNSGRTLFVTVPIVANGLTKSTLNQTSNTNSYLELNNQTATPNQWNGGAFNVNGAGTFVRVQGLLNNIGTVGAINLANGSNNGTADPTGGLDLRDDANVTINVPVHVIGSTQIFSQQRTGNQNGSTFTFGQLTVDPGRNLFFNNNFGNNNAQVVAFSGSTFQGDNILTLISNTGTAPYSFGPTTLNGQLTVQGNAGVITMGALSGSGNLIKTGGGDLNLTADNSGYTGTIYAAGGSVGLGTGNVGPSIQVVSGGTVGVLTSNPDFSKVTFQPGSGIRLRSDAAFAWPSSQTSVLEVGANVGAGITGINLSPRGGNPVAIIRLLNGANGVGTNFSFASNINITGATAFDSQTGNNLNITGQITGPGSLVMDPVTVPSITLSNNNSFSGGLTWNAGTITAAAAGSLGSGQVTVAGTGTLAYNAANASSNAGGQVITATSLGQIALGTSLGNSIGNDTFDIGPEAAITGDPARLSLLSRNGSATRTPNIKLAPGAFIGHTAVGTDINDLGTNADLVYGVITTDNGGDIHIGANSPYMGLFNVDRGADRRFFGGNVIIDDGSNGGTQAPSFTKMTLGGLNRRFTLGNGGGAVNLVKSNPANGQVDVDVYGVIALDSGGAIPGADYSAVRQFNLTEQAQVILLGNNSMGGANGTTPTTIVAQSGSTFDMGASLPLAINGTVIMKAGSRFQLNDNTPAMQGTGQITFEAGSLVDITQTDVLLNSTSNGLAAQAQQLTSNAQPGVIFRISVDNVKYLDEAASDSGIFDFTGGTRNVNGAGTGGITVSAVNGVGGMVTIGNADGTVASTKGITIGSGGATIASSNDGATLRTMTVSAAINGNNNPLTIGSPLFVEGLGKNGHVLITGAFTSPVSSILKAGFGDFIIDNNSTAVAGNLVTGNIDTVAFANGVGGNVKIGNNDANLSPRLVAGTLAANVILRDGVKSDINLDTTNFTTAGGARLGVNQLFTIAGITNSDGRKLFVSRRTPTSGTGNVDLNNITITNNGILTVDEDNTDTRVNLKLASNATATRNGATDDFDYIGISSDTPGAARTLFQGRAPDTLTPQSVFGAISSDITIDQIRATLNLQQGSSLGAGTVINSLGQSHPTPLPDGSATSQLVSGGITISAGAGGTSGISAGTINLGGFQNITVAVNNAASVTTNTVGAQINVTANEIDTISTALGTTGAVAGHVDVNSIALAAGSNLLLNSTNNQLLTAKNVTLSGNATVTNLSSDTNVAIGNVAGGSNKLTVDGRNRTTINGTVNSGGLVANGASLDLAGATINSDITVNTALDATTGTTNLGANKLVGNPFAAGLREARIAGAFDETTAIPSTATVALGPSRAAKYLYANSAASNGIWADNTTYVYSGQVLVGANGTIAFAENFDDSVLIKIDGQQKLRDTSFNTVTQTNVTGLTPGWHDIELRFGQGGGGVGATVNTTSHWGAGQNNTAFGINLDGTTSTDGLNYTMPMDDGTMNLFRTANTTGRNVSVELGATLMAGGFTGLNNVNLNGGATAGARLILNDAASPTADDAAALNVNGATPAASLTVGANHTATFAGFTSATGGNFTKHGPGTMIVTTSHNLGAGSIVNINDGKLVINSVDAGSGATWNVNASGTLGGTGTLAGTIVGNAGHIAPGNSVGGLTAAGLTLNTNTALDIESNGSAADQIILTGTDTLSILGTVSVNLASLGGSYANGQTFTLIDYNGTALPDSVTSSFTVNGTLGGFSASIVNNAANTSIDLLLGTATQTLFQWNVDRDDVWSGAGNWLGGVPSGAGSIVTFGAAITDNRTVTLDSDRTVGSITFNNAKSYTIAGTSTLTLDGGILGNAGITVQSGSHSINAPVALSTSTDVDVAPGSSLTMGGGLAIADGQTLTKKSGTGTLNITGGALSLGAGSHVVLNTGSTSLAPASSSAAPGSGITVNAGASLNIGGGAHALGSLAIADGSVSIANSGGNKSAHLLVLSGLTISGTGSLDTLNNDLVVTYAAGNSPEAQIQQYVNNWKTSAGGPMLMASKFNDASSIFTRTLAVADNANVQFKSFDGQTFAPGDFNQILVKYTYLGDANLDGVVTPTDYAIVDGNIGSNHDWGKGDLNGDGNTTPADYAQIDGNIGAGNGTANGGPQLAISAPTSSGLGLSAVVAVPEPGTLSLLAVGALGLLGRRRRKN